MNRRVVVSAPGKLILMGEHAAVYGEPALVAAVDPRSRVEARLAPRGLLVRLPDLDIELETTWTTAREAATRSRSAWLEYAADPTPELFSQIGAGSPSDLALVALGEVAEVVDSDQLQPLSLTVTSNLPIGSGFGSSASIAVALVGAILTLFQDAAQPEDLDTLVFEIERRQHGLPSGVDHKTVLHGGVVLASRAADQSLEVLRLETHSPDLEKLHVFQTGQPVETTGEVVVAVRRRRDQDPAAVSSLLDRMGSDVMKFRDRLESPDPAPQMTVELIRDYEHCLEELGVVPLEVRQAIREVESVGGAAKISGAGSLTGPAAGCLLVYWPEGPPTRLPESLRQYRHLDVDLGVEGMRLEESI